MKILKPVVAVVLLGLFLLVCVFLNVILLRQIYGVDAGDAHVSAPGAH
jgi:hypothetical protein